MDSIALPVRYPATDAPLLSSAVRAHGRVSIASVCPAARMPW